MLPCGTKGVPGCQGKSCHEVENKDPLSGDVFNGNSVQGAGLDAIPASHAHILKYHGLFEDAIELFDHFVLAGFYANASPFFGIACFRSTHGIVDGSERFFRLHGFYPIVEPIMGQQISRFPSSIRPSGYKEIVLKCQRVP
jgi:hypothetical protein